MFRISHLLALLAITAVAAACPKGPSNPHDLISVETMAQLRETGRPVAGQPFLDALAADPKLAIESDEPLARPLALGSDLYVVGWAKCGPTACRADVAVMRWRGAKVRIIHRARLPLSMKPWRDDMGLQVTALAAVDVDADKRAELVVMWAVTTEPEAAVGSRGANHVAIYALPDLAQAYYSDLGSGGEASVHTDCTATLTRIDLDCDGHPDLVHDESCIEAHCVDNLDDPECRGRRPEVTKVIHRWAAAGYTPVYGHDTVKPLRDGRPHLVVAGSFRVDRHGAADQAERLRKRLADAGFSGAEVVDSRRLEKLRCCFYSVLAGRFATRKEATAQAKKVSAALKKVKAYVKAGF